MPRPFLSSHKILFCVPRRVTHPCLWSCVKFFIALRIIISVVCTTPVVVIFGEFSAVTAYRLFSKGGIMILTLGTFWFWNHLILIETICFPPHLRLPPPHPINTCFYIPLLPTHGYIHLIPSSTPLCMSSSVPFLLMMGLSALKPRPIPIPLRPTSIIVGEWKSQSQKK